MKKAVILLSGGLDSSTVLAIAKQQGFNCYALSFNYGQKHTAELDSAAHIARIQQVSSHKVIGLQLDSIGGSALTDANIAVPETPIDANNTHIPITYVPARNTIFLSLALGWAEVLQAQDIFIGVNAVDYSGYPDCRPAFIEAFSKLAQVATKAGVEGQQFKIHTPLIAMNKAAIIQKGIELGVDYSMTTSCYQADNSGKACGFCDACQLRQQGFKDANISDPTVYQD